MFITSATLEFQRQFLKRLKACMYHVDRGVHRGGRCFLFAQPPPPLHPLEKNNNYWDYILMIFIIIIDTL